MRKLIVLVSLLLVTAAAIAGYQGGGYDDPGGVSRVKRRFLAQGGGKWDERE